MHWISQIHSDSYFHKHVILILMTYFFKVWIYREDSSELKKKKTKQIKPPSRNGTSGITWLGSVLEAWTALSRVAGEELIKAHRDCSDLCQEYLAR